MALKNWSKQRWLLAILSSIITGLVIALPTAIIENPIFGRHIAVTFCSIATYIRNESILDEDKSLKLGTAGALFSFLAVGCPVCNKIALIALGYSGAIKYFAPVQPYLAILGVVILSYALIKRLDGEIACKILTK